MLKNRINLIWLLIISIGLLYVFRSSGLLPFVFADEWKYLVAIQNQSNVNNLRPLYFYYKIFELANYCGDGFLSCARLINYTLYIATSFLIYNFSRFFLDRKFSAYIALLATLLPCSVYANYLMPETLQYFMFWASLILVFSIIKKPNYINLILFGAVLVAASYVKPHIIFTLPAYFLALLIGLINKKNQIYKIIIPFAIYIIARVLIGINFGFSGLELFVGAEYSEIAASSLDLNIYTLLQGAAYNFFGHALFIGCIYGLPLIFIIRCLLYPNYETEVDKSLVWLTFILLLTLVTVTAIFAAKAATMGPYESISRMSIRYYSYAIPLILISAIKFFNLSKINNNVVNYIIILLFLIINFYIIIFGFKGYTPYFSESPELLVLSEKIYLAKLLAIGNIILIIYTFFNNKKGIYAYYFIFIPFYIVVTQFNAYFELNNRRIPDSYDYAGIISKAFVNTYTHNTCIVSGDLSSLYRVNFFMNNPNVKLILSSKPNISDYIGGCSWVISIGNFKYNQTPLFTFIPNQDKVINTQKIEFIKLSESKGLTIIPSASTQHMVGKFNSYKSSMSSIGGENGALIFGPYINMSKGKYVARMTYSSTSLFGDSVGVFDVEGYIPNQKDIVFNRVSVSPSGKKTTIDLPFLVEDEDYQMQFRMWVNGKYENFDLYRIEVFGIDN